MSKFDTIDIFFIAIISTYFITLFCVGITFLWIAIKNQKMKKSDKEKTLVQTLFMKEVKNEENKKVVEPKKIKVATKEVIDVNSVNDKTKKDADKKVSTSKASTNKGKSNQNKKRATTSKKNSANKGSKKVSNNTSSKKKTGSLQNKKSTNTKGKKSNNYKKSINKKH